ncbi:MAG: T9SS type A sorting domain-containing protein [Bacteroidales bacterium]|nr:T9SS type A sorting domain-containing protein [Bacteroidales bacterium]
MSSFKVFGIVFFIVFGFYTSRAQNKNVIIDNEDPCGYDTAILMQLKSELGDHWGYGYTDLLDDLDVWNSNILVTISDIGQSVQGREIPMVTIKKQDESPSMFRIAIHARTHPAEVQSTRVTNEIINELLSGSTFADSILDICIFNIIPMINPDGVELEYSRLNANSVDLESNWNTTPHQAEVQSLKATYQSFMNSTLPIRIALNMHSALQCNRFFVFHDSVGTSQEYAQQEREFITGVRNNWPEGIQNWNHNVTWTASTPLYYPESWFWINYSESVMALTYEDMNCANAGQYEKTAKAILNGIYTFLDNREPISIVEQFDSKRLKVFPNPVDKGKAFYVELPFIEVPGILELYDMEGRRIFSQSYEAIDNTIEVPAINMQNGIYIINLKQAEQNYKGYIIIQ